jgi:hypothetical protein
VRSSALSRRWSPALLSAALVLSIGGLAWRPAMLAAGGLTWLGTVPLLRGLSRRYRRIVLLLTAVGGTGLAIGAWHGVRLEWELVLAGNQPLISMLVAISFVRLVAPHGGGEQSAPVGRAAIWQTIAAVHAFGSVINVTALDIVAKRIFRGLPLPRPELMVLSRGYSTGAFWSPFWGASAAALTYAPTAQLPIMMCTGAGLAAVGLAVSGIQITRAFGPALDKFRGYPLTLDALRLPTTLVAAVLGLHFLLPGVPVVGIIMICAPAVTIALMLHRHPRRTLARLVRHARRILPSMGGELAMFLSAGLLTAGFAALVEVVGLGLPVFHFGVPQAWLYVLLMVGLSAVGVHPVISIAVAANVLAPMQPDPTLFAMAGLIAWGVQAAGGPLSGLNVVLQARFHVDTFRIARWNFGYVLMTLVLAYPTLWLCALWSGAA